MPLTITITRGYTMSAGSAPSVDDWNAAFLPSATLTGGIDAADIADGSITFPKLNSNFILDGTVFTALAADDMLLVGDISAAANRVITVANALNGLFSLAATVATSFTSYTTDKLTLHNGTSAVTMTPARFAEQLLAQAPLLTTTDDADEVLVHDATATDGSQATRVTLSNLLPNKGTAGTYVGVTGITTDAKGRVTAVSTTTGKYVTPTPVTLPVAAGYADGVDIATGLGAMPRHVTAWLQCTDPGGDAGWSQNEIIPMDWVSFDTTTTTYFNGKYGLIPTGTNLDVLRLIQPDAGASTYVVKRSDGDATVFSSTKWKAIVYASL
jgi:hypothetical protein